MTKQPITLNQLRNASTPPELRNLVQYYEGYCGNSYIRAGAWGTIRDWARGMIRQHQTPVAVAVLDSE